MVNFQVVKVPLIAPRELPLLKSFSFKSFMKQVFLRQLKYQKTKKKKEQCNALTSSYCRPQSNDTKDLKAPKLQFLYCRFQFNDTRH